MAGTLPTFTTSSFKANLTLSGKTLHNPLNLLTFHFISNSNPSSTFLDGADCVVLTKFAGKNDWLGDWPIVKHFAILKTGR